MQIFFLKLFNMSINASYLIIAIILFRLIFRNIPKWINTLLWAFVALRLILPFSLESVFSLLPSNEPVPVEILSSQTPSINTGIVFLNQAVNPVISEQLTPIPDAVTTPVFDITQIVSFVWLGGFAVFLLYGIISFVILKKKVAASIYNGNYYVSDRIKTPFILGVIRPRIYIPYDVRQEDVEFILAHENSHIKRFDHFTKPIAFILVSLYWFNPLVWLSYILFCRDVELACDEKVVKKFNAEERKAYSTALLTASVTQKLIAVCPLAFGEIGVKSRIKAILTAKKPAVIVVALSILAIVTLCVCLMTNPADKHENLNVFDISSDLEELVTSVKSYDFESSEPYIEIKWTSEYKNMLTFGDSFQIYKKIDGEWVDCSNYEIFFNAIGYPLSQGKSFVKRYSLSNYDMSEPGTYKFETYCIIDETLLSSDEKIGGKCYTRIEFELEEGIESTKKNQNIFSVDSVVTLTYDNSVEPFYSPSISLDMKNNTFMFGWSMLSSYFARGEFDLNRYELVLKTNDEYNYTYVFNRTDEGFVFDASRSSQIPEYQYSQGTEAVSPVPDGALFKSDNQIILYTPVYDTTTADLDGDGIQEKYSLNYGTTHGLFTFFLKVAEEDFNLSTMFYSEWVEPRFVTSNDGKLFISAKTQSDAVYLWRVKFDGETLDIPELTEEKHEDPSSVKVNYGYVEEIHDTYIVLSEGEDGYIHTNDTTLLPEELFMFYVNDSSQFTVGDKVKVVHTGVFNTDTLLPSQVPLHISKQ